MQDIRSSKELSAAFLFVNGNTVHLSSSQCSSIISEDIFKQMCLHHYKKGDLSEGKEEKSKVICALAPCSSADSWKSPLTAAELRHTAWQNQFQTGPLLLLEKQGQIRLFTPTKNATNTTANHTRMSDDDKW